MNCCKVLGKCADDCEAGLSDLMVDYTNERVVVREVVQLDDGCALTDCGCDDDQTT